MALKKWLKKLPIPLSKNHAYDLQAKRILKKILTPEANCIDVGCHEGEFLDLCLKYAPNGHHIGFEPIPSLYTLLKKKYADTACTFHNTALSDESGQTRFNYVISNPAYSGLKKRQYDKATEQDTWITVKKEYLDKLIPKNHKIDFIKIDVEGAEYEVLRGAAKTISTNQPTIIFEHGLGAADIYNTKPEMVYELLESYGLQINLLNRWLSQKPPLSKQAFCQQFYQNLNYYFIAHKEREKNNC